jgi:hypothetical protein
MVPPPSSLTGPHPKGRYPYPAYDVFRPLSAWEQDQAFDKVADCEEYQNTQMRAQCTGEVPHLKCNNDTEYNYGRCIATDDPRLSQK